MLQVLKGSGGLGQTTWGPKALSLRVAFFSWKQEKTACCWHFCYDISTYVKLFTEQKYEHKTNHQLLILRLDLEGRANGFGDGQWFSPTWIDGRLSFKPKIRLSRIFLQQNPGIDMDRQAEFQDGFGVGHGRHGTTGLHWRFGYGATDGTLKS